MVFEAHPIGVELIQGERRFQIASLLPEEWRILETYAISAQEGGACTPPGEGKYVSIPIFMIPMLMMGQLKMFRTYPKISALHSCFMKSGMRGSRRN
ncbi:MAG: hypothetical protein Greene041619_1010 [Candidatus Peregrinibacteria bacterium Greene0416_19]|nr:MAG: hypothetical protein Greene041619_1010 [Candidatus Peregrinibacteria bacterium Greene0416_19]